MAPVASVAARKVSAKSFFIDCSFHELLYYPQKPLQIGPFYICAKSLQPPGYVFYRCEHQNGNQERKFLNEQLEPLLSGPCLLLWLKAIPRDSRNDLAIIYLP
jgi:hypothetical protein